MQNNKPFPTTLSAFTNHQTQSQPTQLFIKETQPLDFPPQQYFKQSQQCQPVRDLLEKYLSMSVDPSSYLLAGWSKTQWIKENEVRDWFSVLCAACGADVCQIGCQMWQLWALVLSDMLSFSLSLFLTLFLPFCLSLWRRGCLTTPRGYFGTWPLPPSSSPRAALTLSAPPARAAAAGGITRGFEG